MSPSPGAYDRRPEIGSSPTGSRTTRLVGVGLLLGVTVGAVGLVLSHLTHEASSPRGISSSLSAVAPRTASASSSGLGPTSTHLRRRSADSKSAESIRPTISVDKPDVGEIPPMRGRLASRLTVGAGWARLSRRASPGDRFLLGRLNPIGVRVMLPRLRRRRSPSKRRSPPRQHPLSQRQSPPTSRAAARM